MKTILVVAYHYPPENGSCSEKNVKIVKKLVEAGYQVRVLTANYHPNILIKDGVKIYHINSGIFHHNISHSSNEYDNQIHDNNSRFKSRIKRLLSGIAIPDATFDWNIEVKKHVALFPEILEGIDLVYSISSPYSAHLLSRYLAKKIGVPYIMCYGDPWIYEPKRKRGPIRYAIEKKIEGDLIRDASGISLITDWNRREYMKLYNIPDEKINTYLIGYEPSNVHGVCQHDDDSFRMLYGGSLDPVHRDVMPFLKAIKKLNGVHVEIRNNDYPLLVDLVNDLGLVDKVDVKPLVSSLEFDALQYEFDALILFGNKTPFQIPGKVFTYISTGKTIVYIKNNAFEDDGTEIVLKQYGNVIILNNDEHEIANSISNFISRGEYEKEYNSEQFKYQNTMTPLVDMIKRVLE